MKVITVANQKGGVGKSTLVTNLAALFAADGRRTLVVDADPQGSSIAFREKRAEAAEGRLPEFSAVQMLAPTIHKDLQRFAEAFDVVLVDTGGRDSRAFRSAAIPARLVLVPLCPSQYDFWGSADTFDALGELRLHNPAMAVAAVFNMVIPGTRVAGEVLASRADFDREYGARFLETHVSSRVAFKYSAAEGRAVTEVAGKERDERAAAEMTALFAEVREAVRD